MEGMKNTGGRRKRVAIGPSFDFEAAEAEEIAAKHNVAVKDVSKRADGFWYVKGVRIEPPRFGLKEDPDSAYRPRG